MKKLFDYYYISLYYCHNKVRMNFHLLNYEIRNVLHIAHSSCIIFPHMLNSCIWLTLLQKFFCCALCHPAYGSTPINLITTMNIWTNFKILKWKYVQFIERQLKLHSKLNQTFKWAKIEVKRLRLQNVCLEKFHFRIEHSALSIIRLQLSLYANCKHMIFDSLNGCTIHQIFIHCYSFDCNGRRRRKTFIISPIGKRKNWENDKSGAVNVKCIE